MRLVWIVAYALATLGGAAVAMVGIVAFATPRPWVFYAGMALGALMAGAAVTRQSPVRSYLEPAIGGLVAVASLVVASAGALRAFDLGTRNGGSWLLVVAIALATGALTAAGAWLVRSVHPPGILSILAVTTFVTLGLAMVAAILAAVFRYEPRGTGMMVIVAGALGILGGLISQLIVSKKARFLCALGFPSVIALELLATVISGHKVQGEIVLGGIILIAPGIIGSLIGWRVKPKRADQPDVLAAFD